MVWCDTPPILIKKEEYFFVLSPDLIPRVDVYKDIKEAIQRFKSIKEISKYPDAIELRYGYINTWQYDEDAISQSYEYGKMIS